MDYKRLKVKGQVTLELAVTFSAAMIFLLLAIRLFAWFTERIVSRHEAFERSRGDYQNVEFDTEREMHLLR